MRTLKTTLFAIYPILIILLLLNLEKCHCDGSRNIREKHPAEERAEPVEPVAQADSTFVGRAVEVGSSGSLKVTLLWDFMGDIDLHIMQPNGQEIYYSNKRDSSTGGFLDVDNLVGGAGAAENIFWQTAPGGEYKVDIKYYSGGAQLGVCTVVVFQQNQAPRVYKVEMNRVGERKNVTKVFVNESYSVY